MAWAPLAPDGSKSVKANEAILQGNTTYTEDTMSNDHFWDSGGTTDGRHQFVQSPKFESGGSPANPTVASGMDGALYFKQKTAAETALENIIPYFKDAAVSPAVLEMMGIRSCGLVTIGATPTFTIVERYKHNLTSIIRDSAGVYDITFPALPSQYYLPFVMALRRGSAGESAYATIDATVKTTTGMRVLVQRSELTTQRHRSS